MHAAVDQPGNETAQFRLVNLAPLVEGNQKRREDAFELVQTTRIHVWQRASQYAAGVSVLFREFQILLTADRLVV
jgi:hypothetical protein